MHIKKYTAATVKEAMRAIKAELGENALIISNKRIQSGLYEVVAAVEYELTEEVNVRKEGTYGSSNVTPIFTTPKRHEAPVRKSVPPKEDLNAIQKELKELRELKDLCWTVVSNSNTPASGVFSRLEEELTRNGIDKRLAQKILLNVFKGLSNDRSKDLDYIKLYMRNKVFEKMNVSDPLSSKGVVAFIGPAGVGKTTTIAKLAAIHALKKKKKLALLTMDTYRIAAAEQLKVYGKIIGVPVEVAKTSNELASFIEMHSDKDLILIDTAGRSQKNTAHIRELKEIAAIRPDIRFNLVLSSQTRDESLYESVRNFGSMPLDSLTFTKLDEGSVYGPILNTMMLARKPVAYLTTGQRVPEDIEPATRERLINFFMPN